MEELQWAPWRRQVLLFLSLLGLTILTGVNSAAPDGSRLWTSHSLTHPLHPGDTGGDLVESRPVLEWHFHVYWVTNNKDDLNAAMDLRAKLIDMVTRREMIVVLPGINSSILPGLNDSAVPVVNHQALGPHPCGSYEVWVPAEHLVKAMSFFTLERGELTIFIHPLTEHSVEDHTGRAMWLGPQYRLNLAALSGPDPPQYPELGLGYSA